MLDKEKDTLFLITVVQDVSFYPWQLGGAEKMFLEAQEAAKNQGSKLLAEYGKLCHHQKVKHSLLMGTASHIGEMICQGVVQKQVDFLIMGRRGISKIKRLVLGSNSSYCVEYAACNVLIVKGEWGPAEKHDLSREEVVAAEEEERQRRMTETDPNEEHHTPMETLAMDYSKS